MALLWSVQLSSEAQIHAFAVRVCVCMHTEAIHLIQGAVALATVHFQFNSGKKIVIFRIKDKDNFELMILIFLRFFSLVGGQSLFIFPLEF